MHPHSSVCTHLATSSPRAAEDAPGQSVTISTSRADVTREEGSSLCGPKTKPSSNHEKSSRQMPTEECSTKRSPHCQASNARKVRETVTARGAHGAR